MMKLLRNNLISWAFVVVQAAILALLIFMNNDVGNTVQEFHMLGNVFKWLGLIIIILAAIELRASLTALPLPKESGSLSVNGLYRYVRHPMYSGVLSLSLGIALAGGNLIKYGLFIALALLFYFKSVFEERFLIEKYPDYKDYAVRTPRFFPFIVVR